MTFFVFFFFTHPRIRRTMWLTWEALCSSITFEQEPVLSEWHLSDSLARTPTAARTKGRFPISQTSRWKLFFWESCTQLVTALQSCHVPAGRMRVLVLNWLTRRLGHVTLKVTLGTWLRVLLPSDRGAIVFSFATCVWTLRSIKEKLFQITSSPKIGK